MVEKHLQKESDLHTRPINLKGIAIDPYDDGENDEPKDQHLVVGPLIPGNSDPGNFDPFGGAVVPHNPAVHPVPYPEEHIVITRLKEQNRQLRCECDNLLMQLCAMRDMERRGAGRRMPFPPGAAAAASEEGAPNGQLIEVHEYNQWNVSVGEPWVGHGGREQGFVGGGGDAGMVPAPEGDLHFQPIFID